MNYPKINVDKIEELRVTNNTKLFDLMKEWEKKVKPHLTSKEIVDALKFGFDDHFSNEKDLEEYPWENPRLDHFGAIGFAELHEIMDEETFRNYIGDDYKAYFTNLERKYKEDECDYEDYQDFIKEHSYFAYRSLNRCHHLAPFLYELGRKMYPQYDWYIFETPAHSNAIGMKDNEIKVVVDLLWGKLHKNAKDLISEMMNHSVRILKHQLKDHFSKEQFLIIEKHFQNMKEKMIN